MGWFHRFINLLKTVPYTNNRRLVLISSRPERRFGDWFSEMRKSRRLEGMILPPSHPDDVRVQKIAKNIIAAMCRELMKDRHGRAQTVAHVEEFKWRSSVVDHPIHSAYCCPGGKIFVNTGMICDCTSDAEIAVNISHEVGHAVARHSAQEFSATIVLFTILDHVMPYVATGISFYFLHLSHFRR